MPARRLAAPALCLLLLPAPVVGAPAGHLPVGDPLEAELRVLDLLPPGLSPVALPHLHTRPLQRRELWAQPALPREGMGVVGQVSLVRLARELGRDAGTPLVHGTTARLIQRVEGGERFEASAAVGGEAAWTRDPGWSAPRWRDGSGVRTQLTLASGAWLAHADLTAGTLRDARRFTDALVEGRDLALTTEDSYLQWSASPRAALWVGRSRWHWGPGEEGSLLLSRTAPALSGLALRARVEPLRADLAVLHATTDPGRGEQLAAHRIEWQPTSAVRLGLSESARYRASGWQAVYLASIIPFSVAQRLLDQDRGAPDDSVRNNVMAAVDAAWRVADGTRLHGELLLDDLHQRSGAFPDKWGWQLGLDGAGAVGGRRLTWNGEYTRLYRWVYTSYYGRTHAARGDWLGHPAGPDARRLRLRVSVDPSPDWQLTAIVTQTDRGANADAPFVPGSPVADPMALAGVVESTRRIEGEARWWPASGVLVALRLGHERLDDAGHVAGATCRRTLASLALRLQR